MNLTQFRRILLQVFLVPLVALCLTACVLYAQIVSSTRTVDLIRRSDARIAQVALATRLIADEEAGVHGYDASHDPQVLDPVRGSRPRIEAVFRSLDIQPGSRSPDGKPYHGIQELEQSYTAWHTAYADPVIAAVARGDSTPDLTRERQGEVLIERVRSELTAVMQRAEDRRSARLARWQQQTRETEIALFALALGAGALLGLFSRNRLHAVSAAYRATLQKLTVRNDESFRSEQKLQTTLSSIADGVIACDDHCNVELMNPIAEQLTGWPLAEARGLPIEQIFPLMHEVTRAPLLDPVRRVRQCDEIVSTGEHALLLQRNGHELPIADRGAPIRGQDGSTQGIVVVFRDVSGERRTQEALLAQERLASAGRLAATIAHEIHNPLDSVASLLYLMRDGGTREEMDTFLNMASSELMRVTEISRAMLGMHRESAAPVALDTRHTLRDVLLLLRRRALDLGVTVDADLPPGIVVRGYPAELKQVFTNLITNAFEAVGTGGEVLVRVARQEDRNGHDGAHSSTGGVEIVVRDNGPGIEPRILETLFRPFVTTKGEHGTGLGLWVSRGIIAKHGGTLELESRTDVADHGTTARVRLPAS